MVLRLVQVQSRLVLVSLLLSKIRFDLPLKITFKLTALKTRLEVVVEIQLVTLIS